MGSGDHHHKHFLNFHLHLHLHQKKDHQMMKLNLNHGNSSDSNYIPKGCMAIMVGHEGEEQRRFIIPVMYIYHPLFMELLKEAEEEYGFEHQGPINIPCDVQQFCNVQGLIDKDTHLHHHHHHHHHHHIWCFRA